MGTAARLPKLTELDVSWFERKAIIPVGLFSNLSKLSVSCSEFEHFSFVSQMAIVIANSPHLRFLEVSTNNPNEVPPTLSDLFAKVSTKNSLGLEHLSIFEIDATVTKATLPHLTHLTSFEFQVNEEDLAARIWTSFRVNNIRLSDVAIRVPVTKEAILYLSSFSGLKRLVVDFFSEESLDSMLFAEVLPKHVNSLQTLHILGWVNRPIVLFL
jgi:Leucine-rich repeat (LRR) protein